MAKQLFNPAWGARVYKNLINNATQAQNTGYRYLAANEGIVEAGTILIIDPNGNPGEYRPLDETDTEFSNACVYWEFEDCDTDAAGESLYRVVAFDGSYNQTAIEDILGFSLTDAQLACLERLKIFVSPQSQAAYVDGMAGYLEGDGE